MAGNKDNMKQAMKELLGLVGVGPEADKDEEIDLMEEQQEVAKAVERELYNGAQENEEKPRFSGGFIRRKDDRDDMDAAPRQQEENEPNFGRPFVTKAATTIISAGTSIFGDIRCEGEVEIQGKLKGNLEAAGNVRVTGKVLGDVKGDGVDLIGCAVQGNITASSSVRMDQGAVVVGDVMACNLTTDGKMKGNVQVEKNAAFQKNAVLAGNVTAALVSMCEGAKIQGTVRINEDNETSGLFGEDLDI